MSTPSIDIVASWPTPDYDNPHEPLDTVIYAVNIPLMALMTVFVASRFVSRTFLVRNALGMDDWMMLIAYVRMGTDFFFRVTLLTLTQGASHGDVGMSVS